MSKGQPSYDQGLFLMHLHRGKEYFDQNDLQKAREELEAAREMRPQDEKVLNILGMTYFKLEMLPQAEEMYDALASKNPDIYTLQSNLGLIQLKQDKLDKAARSLGRALELQPANPKAHFYLGLLQEKKQQWQEALKHFEFARAEKMISKMRAKIEEERHQEEMILPFQVLDVIEVKETPVEPEAMAEELPVDVATVTEEEEPFELPPVEAVVEEPIFDMAEEEPPEMQDSPTVKISDVQMREAMEEVRSEMARSEVLHFPQPATVPEDEDELFEDATPEVADEPVEQAPILSVVPEERKNPWENTEPSLILEEITETESDIIPDEPPVLASDEPSEPAPFEAVEQAVTVGMTAEAKEGEEAEKAGEAEEAEQEHAELAPAVQSDGSFFLMEEMAADISTFLAQTRMQEETANEGEILFDEPPPMMLFGVEQMPPIEAPAAEALFERRIPSPEEVENETQDIGAEALFEREQSHVTETPLETERPAIAEEAEIATAETPAVIEEPVASIMEEQLMEFSEPEVREETEPDSEIATFATQAMDIPEESSIEAAVAEASVSTVFEEEPALEAESKFDAPPEQLFSPANLQQLSRERFYMQPLAGADRFVLIDPHLLQIVLSEKLICRTGTISSYTGNLQFGPWNSEYREVFPLAEVKGNGIIFFADRRKEIFILSLNQETIYIEANHLLVAQSVLNLEAGLMNDRPPARSLPILKASGRGTLALSSQTKPLTLRVQQNLPVHVPSDGLIAWSGELQAEVIHDAALRKVLMSSTEEQSFLRFTGTGDVVVEQGSLSGDRRKKN